MSETQNCSQAAFKKFSKKTEAFETTDLRDVFEAIGFRLNNQILNSIVYRYGSDENTISFENFASCAVKVKFMVEAFKSKDHNNNNEATFGLDEWIAKGLYV